LVAIGEFDLMSTTILRLPVDASSASAMPLAPNSTASTSGVSGTIVKTMSESRVTSAALAQARALDPAMASGSGPTVWTYNGCPSAMRCSAMGDPMMPRPMNPSFMSIHLGVRGGIQ
jgi:hypothetical protein